MSRFLWLSIFLVFPGISLAASPVFVTPTDADALTTIDEPALERTYYGTLAGFPHGYKLVLPTSQTITFEIREPASGGALQNMSGIVVSVEERGVTEIARLHARDAAWEPMFDYTTGDRYRVGGVFTKELQPGTYLVEISNGDNDGRYALSIGDVPNPRSAGYFGTLREIYRTKQFLGKPFFMVLTSPYYYIPSLLLLLIGWWYYRRRSHYA